MIEVIHAGFLTTVQDLGRQGYQSFGVGIAGALDRFALSAANLLAANPAGAAGLEMTLLGPTLRFREEAIFAIAGADLSPCLDGQPISNWTCHAAPKDAVLSFPRARQGSRAYLAVSGGINLPPVLGSRSTYLLGRFGGMAGRPLKRGDAIRVGLFPEEPGAHIGRTLDPAILPRYEKNPSLRVVLGPFADFFSAEGIRTFLSAEYAITPQSNRMGYRLEGEAIQRGKEGELISCGLADGAIQVPPSGQPIVLLADRQTMGGYPIIATVISADLPLIAQCGPGNRIRFSPVSVEEGRQAYLNLWGKLMTAFHRASGTNGDKIESV